MMLEFVLALLSSLTMRCRVDFGMTTLQAQQTETCAYGSADASGKWRPIFRFTRPRHQFDFGPPTEEVWLEPYGPGLVLTPAVEVRLPAIAAPGATCFTLNTNPPRTTCPEGKK